MATTEDCASVLEQFIQDVANLPAEINHMMEEIQAKDREMQKHQTSVNAKDGAIQKHIKLNSSLVPHPKEQEYRKMIEDHYVAMQKIQDQKIALSDKACLLLDRQIKKLDVKIRELQNDGQLLDGPPIPSIFSPKQQTTEAPRFPYSDIPPHHPSPLQITSGNVAAGIQHANMTAHRTNNAHSTNIVHPIPTRISQISTSNPIRSSAPATPASALHTVQRSQRESSVGTISVADSKRRRINAGANLTASNLRQSSLGPGGTHTPKAGTPTGTSNRGGSVPRSTAPTSTTGTGIKKSSLAISKKSGPLNPTLSKLKGKPTKRMSGSYKRKGGSPSVRSRGGTADDDDSVLSSAEVSEAESATPSATGRGRRSGKERAAARNAKLAGQDNEDVDMDGGGEGDGEGEDDQEDTKEYCFCHNVSYGDMVGCENDNCPYEWFHLKCVGLKEPPKEEDTWYCPECRTKPGMTMKMR